jgi:hypothetical protein
MKIIIKDIIIIEIIIVQVITSSIIIKKDIQRPIGQVITIKIVKIFTTATVSTIKIRHGR